MESAQYGLAKGDRAIPVWSRKYQGVLHATEKVAGPKPALLGLMTKNVALPLTVPPGVDGIGTGKLWTTV
ncbi:MAG: hypothetical protein U1B80_10600 [Anaerolineaceae bacterium]|nr:hypothetical protein [Anaerolineaceae bacterium]